MGGLTETPSRGRVLAILGFHKIGGPPAGGWDTWFYVSEATFSSFLSQLQEGGWHVIDLQTFLVGLAAPASLPTRSALLTFDDGYRSMRQIAAHSSPVLLREGILYVRVLQPALHYELEQVSKIDILRKLKLRFGAKVIRDVRFRVG